MFTEPVVRAYAAQQGGAMFIEPWSVGTRHPVGCNVIEPVVRAYAAPQRVRCYRAVVVSTPHPSGVQCS
jgi:hypothetical protein